MEFYNNQKNENLKFKINTEGVDINNIEPRLILKNEKNNYIFFGKIEEDICIFNIPELNSYEKNDEGVIKFEIISEDLYFPVWKDNFNIKTKASITFEKIDNDVIKNEKPKISIDAILEKPREKTERKIDHNKPIMEKVDKSEKILKRPDKIKKNQQSYDDDGSLRIKKFGGLR